MIKTKTITIEQEEVIEITCDKCRESYAEEEDPHETQEFHHIKFTGGFDSVFGDMSEVECDICQHCLLEMIKDICRIKNPF